jgi:hypothetical protein
MNDDIVITKQGDLTFEILAKRVQSGDETWIMFILSLGRTWALKGDKNNNRKNVHLSMREYWKGTYEQ